VMEAASKRTAARVCETQATSEAPLGNHADNKMSTSEVKVKIAPRT